MINFIKVMFSHVTKLFTKKQEVEETPVKPSKTVVVASKAKDIINRVEESRKTFSSGSADILVYDEGDHTFHSLAEDKKKQIEAKVQKQIKNSTFVEELKELSGDTKSEKANKKVSGEQGAVKKKKSYRKPKATGETEPKAAPKKKSSKPKK